VKVRPAALKNEEAQKACKQHAVNRAVTALAGYGVMLLHVFYYYAFTSALSTSRILVPRNARWNLGRASALNLADPGSAKRAVEPRRPSVHRSASMPSACAS
jgi:hypothetical protein